MAARARSSNSASRRRWSGALTDHGPVPRGCRPIFRDRQRTGRLGRPRRARSRKRSAGSRFLIVLCSPAAAASRWTNAEIDELQAAPSATAACSPRSSTASRSPARCPGARRRNASRPRCACNTTAAGGPTAKRAEPIAADLREGGDGRQHGAAQDRRRDARRRARRAGPARGAAAAAAADARSPRPRCRDAGDQRRWPLIAIQARDAARDQRREAEGLVGFMLGDLRAKLEPIGRLDALDAVGARALEYYREAGQSGACPTTRWRSGRKR